MSVDTVTLSSRTQSFTMTGDQFDDLAQRIAPVLVAPNPKSFLGAYQKDPSLNVLADILIERHDLPASQFHVAYLWKQTGGKCLGQCAKANAFTTFFAGIDFVIWLAADHAFNRNSSPEHLEALLYHELRHIGMNDKGKPILLDHEFEGFRDELDLYGCWADDLAAAKAHFAQAELLIGGI